MSGFGRGFRHLVAALCVAMGPAWAEAPTRVVSMNLCTDLLALELAPDSVVAVSGLARDPTSSPIADLAAAYPATVGTAEDIYLMSPDLVLAGSFTERSTIEMLRRLDIRVEEFAPAQSLEDIRRDLRRMGRLLGREVEAARWLEAFDTGLESVDTNTDPPPRALTYFANGYALGNGTLVGTVLEAAGLRNVAAERGLAGGGRLSLEHVVLEEPDLIISGARYPGTSRSEHILDHPALRAATRGRPLVIVPDSEWICGTPHILASVARLVRAADMTRAER